MAKSVFVVNETEALANHEIFGEKVREEVRKAKHALNDFARYLPKLQKDKAKWEAELDACTKRGQTSAIMSRVRRQYL